MPTGQKKNYYPAVLLSGPGGEKGQTNVRLRAGDRWWFTKTINVFRIRKPLPTACTKALAEEAGRHALLKLRRKRYGGADDHLISDFINKGYLPWMRNNKSGPREDERKRLALGAHTGRSKKPVKIWSQGKSGTID